jgi:hypothetical protein
MRCLSSWKRRLLFSVNCTYLERPALLTLVVLSRCSLDSCSFSTEPNCEVARIAFNTPTLLLMVMDTEVAFEAFYAEIQVIFDVF